MSRSVGRVVARLSGNYGGCTHAGRMISSSENFSVPVLPHYSCHESLQVFLPCTNLTYSISKAELGHGHLQTLYLSHVGIGAT